MGSKVKRQSAQQSRRPFAAEQSRVSGGTQKSARDAGLRVEPARRDVRARDAAPARTPGRTAGFTLLEVLLAAALLALLLGYVGSALAQQARELRRSRADAEAVAGARLAASLLVEAARRYDELQVRANGRRLVGRNRDAQTGRWNLILSVEDRRPDRGQGDDLTRDTFWYNRAAGTLERCYDPSALERWDRAVDGLAEVGLEMRKAQGEPGQPDRWVALTITAQPPGATGPYTVSTWLRLERP